MFSAWTTIGLANVLQVIHAVTVAPVTWPLASVGLLVVAVIAVLVGSRRGATRGGVRVAYTLCTAAVVAYPFLRAPAPAVLSGRLPADDDTRQALTQLLTNIYRAFDYRTEDAIYDRLEVSATGDQLAAIYLDHLRALELENRGGARASVDEVDVQNVRRVAASDQGFRLDADWTVSGSVSHFGHTHYRKNRYAAAVSIIVEDGAWKISGIEVLEEERVL